MLKVTYWMGDLYDLIVTYSERFMPCVVCIHEEPVHYWLTKVVDSRPFNIDVCRTELMRDDEGDGRSNIVFEVSGPDEVQVRQIMEDMATRMKVKFKPAQVALEDRLRMHHGMAPKQTH